MADFNDSLSIDVQVQLANARREYETFKREVEQTPLKIASDFSVPTKENRTFGGMPGPTGPGVEVRPSQGAQTVLNSTMGAQVQSAFVHRSLGGSGFGPTTGPVGSAWQNGFYGDATKFVQAAAASSMVSAMSPMQAQAQMAKAAYHPGYQGYVQRAIGAGVMNPMTMGQFGQPGGLVLAERELYAWRQQKAANAASSWNYNGSFSAWNPNTAGTVSVPAGMGPRAFQPGASAGGYRLGAGESFGVQPGMGFGFSTATQIASTATAALVGADSFIAANQRQRDISRYDPMISQAEQAYSDLRGVSGIKRWTGNLFNNLREMTPGYNSKNARKFTDQGAIDDAFTNLQVLQGDASTRGAKIVARAIDARTGMVGSDGFGAEASASRESVNVLIRDLQKDEFKNNVFLRESQYVRIGAQERLNAATQRDISSRVGMSALQSIGSGQAAAFAGDNNQYAAGMAELMAKHTQEQYSLRRQSQGLGRADAMALAASTNYRQAQESAAFMAGYNRSAGIQTLGMQASAIGFGGSYAGQSAALGMQQQATMMGLPGYGAYSRGEAISAADRNRIGAQQNNNRLDAARLRQEQWAFGFAADSSIAASQARMGGGGLAADVMGIASQFAIDNNSLSRDSERYGQNQRVARQNASEAIFNRGFSASQSSIGLRGAISSTISDIALDPIGAQAKMIEANTATQIRAFAAMGQSANAEDARTLGSLQLDKLSRQYSLSFRAEQYDLQNMTPFNPRDVQNPENAFAEIGAARNGVNSVSSDPAKIVADSTAEGIRQLLPEFQQVIQRAMESLLAK